MIALLRDILAPLRDLLVQLEEMINLLIYLLNLTEMILLRDPEVKLLRDTAHPDLSLFANFVGLIDII